MHPKSQNGQHAIFLNFWNISNFVKFAASYLIDKPLIRHQLIFIHFGNEKKPDKSSRSDEPPKLMIPYYFDALKLRFFNTNFVKK